MKRKTRWAEISGKEYRCETGNFRPFFPDTFYLSMKRVILLFVLFGFYQLISTQQTCSFQENGFYSYDEVLQCFKSIPLDYQVKTQTLETMRRSLEVYAFYDIAHDSPDPNLPLKVNMQKGLQEIYDRPYVFDIDFQEDLRYLYIQVPLIFLIIYYHI